MNACWLRPMTLRCFRCFSSNSQNVRCLPAQHNLWGQMCPISSRQTSTLGQRDTGLAATATPPASASASAPLFLTHSQHSAPPPLLATNAVAKPRRCSHHLRPRGGTELPHGGEALPSATTHQPVTASSRGKLPLPADGSAAPSLSTSPPGPAPGPAVPAGSAAPGARCPPAPPATRAAPAPCAAAAAAWCAGCTSSSSARSCAPPPGPPAPHRHPRCRRPPDPCSA